MKNNYFILVVCLCMMLVDLFTLHCSGQSSASGVGSSGTIGFTNSTAGTSFGAATSNSITFRSRMTTNARQAWLERNGEVPADADHIDWELAEGTTWWGKPIDPKSFWIGRVVWEDQKADFDASRHGRQFPPMPYEDTNFTSYSALDVKSSTGLMLDPKEDTYGSHRENVFWQKFGVSHPRPPQELERFQFDLAERYYESVANDEISLKDAQDFKLHEVNRAITMNYPRESLTDDALFCVYINNQRLEYGRLVSAGLPANGGLIRNFLTKSGANSHYISDPVPDGRLSLTNVWKIAYLQRLRNERVDDSYINAYLKAWGLSTNDISAK
jgi:hypothetical protein